MPQMVRAAKHTEVSILGVAGCREIAVDRTVSAVSSDGADRRGFVRLTSAPERCFPVECSLRR
jgi:hypothetical protein